MTSDLLEAAAALKLAMQKMVDRAQIHDEKGVKRLVRRMLTKSSAESFMPPAAAYGKSGISDIIAVKHGLVVFIETKYGYNKPTANQLAFGKRMTKAGALFVVVNERDVVEKMARVLLYLETGRDINACSSD